VAVTEQNFFEAFASEAISAFSEQGTSRLPRSRWSLAMRAFMRSYAFYRSPDLPARKRGVSKCITRPSAAEHTSSRT